MFPYFGTKYSLAKMYSHPKYDLIIEPFAGAAQYSLLHYKHQVLLIDKYDVIIKLWKWLQTCEKEDILKLPRPKAGDRVSDFIYDCEEAKLLMGFLSQSWIPNPREAISSRGEKDNFNTKLKRIANNLFKIKHWQFQLGDYRDIQNQEATWFIDPPYQHGGENYKHHDIDYQELAEWCRSRKGQVIVCENTKADWLSFHPMKKINGTANTKTTEAIWSNLKTGYEYRQMPMFDPVPSPSES